MRWKYKRVLEKTIEKLEDLGFDKSVAEIVGSILLEAESRGYSSQGLCRIAEIEKFVRSGLIDPQAAIPRVELRAPAVAIIKAPSIVGHSVAVQAIDKAMDLAAQFGIGMTGVVGASHIGYLTHYAERAAESGHFAVVASVSSPAVSMPLSGSKVLGTNPLAYAFPMRNGIFCADFSLAKSSRGEVLAARQDDRLLQSSVGYDVNGRATNDPESILNGAIAPIGDSFKGVLINLLFSLLAGPLIGGVANHKVRATRWPTDIPNKGDFFLCVDIEAIGSTSAFVSEVHSQLQSMMAISDDFHVSGENSRDKWNEVRKHGIELPNPLLELIKLKAK